MHRPLPARIYHLAEAANWPSIRRHGLLSTEALLDLAGVPKRERDRIGRRQRLGHTTLPNGVQVRDQKPLPERALRGCLVGVTPAQWYALINSKVFFWLDPDRLNRQRRACEPRPQIVLEVDTERLVGRYAERIALSPINTGHARRRPAKRGPDTFVPYREWIESGWPNEPDGRGDRFRVRRSPPAELAVADGVPDIMHFVIQVHRLGPAESFRVVTNLEDEANRDEVQLAFHARVFRGRD
jgi:hypothetical protein